MERTEHHFFLPNVKPSVLARATMIMVCFVVTHSFFHCFGCSYTVGHALKCQLRRPLGHSETRMGFKRGTFVQISPPPTKKKCIFCTVLTRQIVILQSRFFKSPLHKPRQTAVNNSSFIIKWVCWIQLFYSCTFKKNIWILIHHYCSCGRADLKKKKKLV